MINDLDDLDGLTKKELGELLLTEIKYDQKMVDWLYKRHTADGLRIVIRNIRGLDIIADLARKAGGEWA